MTQKGERIEYSIKGESIIQASICVCEVFVVVGPEVVDTCDPPQRGILVGGGETDFLGAPS